MEDLKIILAQHAAWLRGEAGGVRANPYGVNLSGADLQGADLRDADLQGACLSEADLREANLLGAYLRKANLRKADLSGADLRKANLRKADLSGADLREADLRDATLAEADLRETNLPPPPTILLARWGVVPDELCVELMRYDAANHPDPARFDAWTKGEGCPYSGAHVQRAASFTERRDLWSPGPPKSAYELMTMLFKAKGVEWGRMGA